MKPFQKKKGKGPKAPSVKIRKAGGLMSSQAIPSEKDKLSRNRKRRKQKMDTLNDLD